ncbi:hypothetical protein L211DRAFT_871899 [Terfezia boudieri ATCC MYA-4762]|uniref:Uncharacterized protein n=1 Tax=Terfezia boudieri ATCC MYA-4762 TaxID=1051890 RepID=A0A3N4L8R2_9PEZI|nr:hypothetical protein L211DRAFT_871899 [Terfezia boudieri ATCC MYA-4762]
MTLPSYHPPLQEYPKRPPYQPSEILLAPPTASVIATFAFASSPAIAQDVIGLPPYGDAELITSRIRRLLGTKTFDKFVVADAIKRIHYPRFLVLAAPHLRNTGTLLVGVTLEGLRNYKRDSFSSFDVSYDPVSDRARVSVWWVRDRKEERKLLKGYLTEIYAPAWIRELERNRAEKKLSYRIAQLLLKI